MGRVSKSSDIPTSLLKNRKFAKNFMVYSSRVNRYNGSLDVAYGFVNNDKRRINARYILKSIGETRKE